MNKKSSRDLVERIFKRIDEAKTVEHLKEISKDESISEYVIDETKYPRIKFDISPDEIKTITMDGELLTFPENYKPTPIEKLLYSLVWKLGNLKKVNSIIKGIKRSENNSDRVVFYYFGKYLANKTNPIIDQNVIRAFKCHNANGLNEEFSLKDESKDLTKKDEGIITAYIKWIKEISSKFDNKEDCIYEIDRILFALGKAIKAK